MRLDRYLADMGAGTRSDLKTRIRKGAVTVNGIPVRDPGTQVEAGDEVLLAGVPVRYEEFEYIMMYKPEGVLTATRDGKTRTVLDVLRDGTDGPLRKGIAPAGRLDMDAEGMLLLTNDGGLMHRLLSPSKHVPKLYFARLDAPAGEADAAAFAAGIELPAVPGGEGFRALPAVLLLPGAEKYDDKLPPGMNTALLLELAPEMADRKAACAAVIVQEGKFHEVKRLFARRGRTVTGLKRLSMGRLTLDPDLRPGQFRKLSAEERRELPDVE